jgi:DNA-binding NarL/FixJ family response regulator
VSESRPKAHVRSRVAIVDDHPLVREGLAARISAQPDLEMCGEASDIDGALALMRETQPDLLIIDLALKGGSGLELIKRLTSGGSAPRILVVSAYEEEVFAERVLRAGAQGYLNKQELQGSVIDAIRAVLRGDLAISACMSQRLASQALSRPRAARGLEALSDRELQVFELIGRGASTRGIAEQLNLSVHTVESHRENIRLKLHLRNGTELLRSAVLWTLESVRAEPCKG